MRRGVCLTTLALAFLGAGGCGGENLIVLMRDSSALDSEVADSLMKVADEASAEYFCKRVAPRLKNRHKKLHSRKEMYMKAAAADAMKLMEEIRGLVDRGKKGGADLGLDDFEKIDRPTLFMRLVNESNSNQRRLGTEIDRLTKILDALELERMLQMQDELKRPIKKGEVNRAVEWPHLHHVADVLNYIYGGSLGVL